MPDEKLKDAMEEIKIVLKKYDIAGVVVLASTSHLEYLREYSPSWSCCRVEQLPGGFQIRVKAKREDFASAEEQRAVATNTVGMIAGFADALTGEVERLKRVLVMIGQQIPFDHMTRDEGPGQ